MVTKTALKTTAIQTPTADNAVTVMRQLKEVAEVGQRLRGDPNDSFVRVSELVNAGIMRLVNDTLQPPTVSSLPGSVVPSTRAVNTSGSLTGGGTLAADLTLQLSGDSASPGNSKLYGTNGTGVKGWYAQPATGATSPLTTKGDVWVFSSVDARLPVGSNGNVLTADSTQATGLKWAGSAANPNTTKGDLTGFDTVVNRVPVGSNGNVLTADSTQALGLKWAAPAASPNTTKGDLTGFDTVVNRVPVGSNGNVLTADSTQALGLKWAAPAASSPLTTKGDIFGFSTVAARVPVGTNGQVLVSDSTAATGLSWQTNAGSSTTNITPDTHPAITDNANDEFETGASIDTAGTRFSGATAWTAFGLSTGTSAVGQGSLAFKPALTASRNVGGYSQPTSGATWSYTCKVASYNASGNTFVGIFVAATNAAGKIMLIALNGSGLIVQKLTNNTTFSANSVLTAAFVTNAIPNTSAQTTVPVYLRITYDGTNIKFFISSTGVEGTFFQAFSETLATFLGAQALIGICGDNESATVQAVGIYDWFRKTA